MFWNHPLKSLNLLWAIFEVTAALRCQVTWTWRGSSWWTATRSAWIGCVSAMTAVRRWSWRRRRTWRLQSVCSGSSCRSSPSQLSRQRSRGTYCSYTKVCVSFCSRLLGTFNVLCCSAWFFSILYPRFFSFFWGLDWSLYKWCTSANFAAVWFMNEVWQSV